MEKDRKKEAGKGIEGWFAAASKRSDSKSTEQGGLSSPLLLLLPSSTLFLGLFSLLEQNPGSVPCTCKRIITSGSLGDTGLVSAGRSDVVQMELSARICKTLAALELNQ